jgi:electron transport complex protein RnfE
MNPTPNVPAREWLIRGLFDDNPVFRQLLGLCPVLAVTANMRAAMTMAAAVAFVLLCSNLLISLIRDWLKPHLRIVVFTLTIATFVTVADRVIAAFAYPMSKELGPYLPLIIVNCIIICRCEVCASRHAPLSAAADAIGQSFGFAIALTAIASVREILGTGRWFGWAVLPETWPGWVVMILPPGAFLTFAILIALLNAPKHLPLRTIARSA